jgi:hypothetical protein
VTRAAELEAPDADAAVGEELLRELADALELVYGLDREDRDYLMSLLDTADDDAAVVDRHAAELARLTGIDDRDALVAWVALVRPTLLAELANGLNQCEAAFGGRRLWTVAHGTVVADGGIAHRELERRVSARRSPLGIVARTRARGRRRRSTSSRRSRARSAGRKPAEPGPPRRRRLSGARAA